MSDSALRGIIAPNPKFVIPGAKIAYTGHSQSAQGFTSNATNNNMHTYGHQHHFRGASRGRARVDIGDICSFSGITLFQMNNNANYLAKALAAKPRFLIIDNGVNDYNAGTLFSATKAQVDEANSRALAINATPVWHPVMANANSTSGQREQIDNHNNYLRNVNQLDPRILVSDPAPWIDDNESSTTQPVTGVLFDGLHQAARGAQFIGTKADLRTLDLLLPPTPRFITSNANVYGANRLGGFLNANPNLAGTAGTKGGTGSISGNVATGYDVSDGGSATGTMSCVCAKVARTDGINGNLQQLTLAGTPVTAGYYRLMYVITKAGVYSDGDRLFCFADIELPSGFTNIEAITLEMFDYDGVSASFGSRDGTRVAGQAYYNGDTLRYMLVAPLHTVITNSAYLTFDIQIWYGAAAGGAVAAALKVNSMGCFKV